MIRMRNWLMMESEPAGTTAADDQGGEGMTQPVGSIFAPRARSVRPPVVYRILLTLLTWDARWRERRHLADLSDEALVDIGRTRAEMDAESSKPCWQP